ncbi:MAG TPA: biotin carboxylase N-terminal domain-containing protein, partial [Conexibacter sp.]|nr:biotin carboxylase N-terminal domain-containing protein [Conexibacter sp.]
AADSYLRVGTIVEAALGTGCDAIHPGYGFLAENAAFAAAAAEHGLRFVGPRAEVIELTGDKLRARTAAAAAGLPLVPGRAVESRAEAERLAEEIGYPLLLKAAAGGGGRGIKLARDAAELATLYEVAAAEAGAAFGDARLYAERFITAARHVEVQILADEHGAVIHLGERDCSTQRRYQKLVEEAPAPCLAPALRDAACAAAVAFARSVGYTNAGTVELVVDVERERFAFLEMNCRIQVEHPVTEAVTGVDLVAEQLAIADGRPLSLAQEDVVFDGHAIECRLTAEDPQQDFRPSPGRLRRFALPDLPGVRVDTHCEEGTLIPPYYDSLMAKLIAHGPDRESARALLLEALERVEVEGVATNRALLAQVLGEPRFVAGELTTRWLEEALA